MSQKDIKVGGIELKWDIDKGEVLFEGGDVVFFWVSAMETFFDSIREIVGEEAARLVLETTGFRQGVIVGSSFSDMKEINTSNVVDWLSSTYAPAGWGKVTIVEMDEANHRFTIHTADDWEYKMNQLNRPGAEEIFVPSHYAGVLTGLFGRNFWYNVISYQGEGRPHSVIEYFPSDITVQQNIRDLSRRQEAGKIRELEQLVDEKTATLQNLIRELSSPIIPVLEGIIVVPMIGSYDQQRGNDLIERTLAQLPKHQAQYLLLDLTGLNGQVDEYTAELIDKLGAATNLLGSETILVGVSPKLAMMITSTLSGLKKFECLQSLQHGIYYALGKSGRSIV